MAGCLFGVMPASLEAAMVLFLDLILTIIYAATFLCQTKLDWMATSTVTGTALVQAW